ncbi:uncharacterized protein LAESUDRAFT_149730 [Laetiporus sulphureus 93-53]|uniref:Uncharacterized protein n=1 Tax=Laetiporus sulphureus 93-53 TaxID=1314785 RepID=A0A165ECA1_9APHY|nr:uncharacterized protein LAESUDRAFT_149730 [Laetiporus sulphureus 93-53]KZT06716.1 hypothetical protein LAESUDRAFT_149730 [Laetiporus sulphureus 93-53]
MSCCYQARSMPNTPSRSSSIPESSSSSSQAHSATPPPPRDIPSIRLLSATPYRAGDASDASMSTQHTPPSSSSSIAPRSEARSKHLVPKKSKLQSTGSKSKEKLKNDFSSAVRRVSGASASQSADRGGFDIYVDHTDDPDLEEVVVVKKRKSRRGLDNISWDTLGDVTNTPPGQKDGPSKPKPKVKEDSDKWWSFGHSHEGAKVQEKENDKAKRKSRTFELAKPPGSQGCNNLLDSDVGLSQASHVQTPSVSHDESFHTSGENTAPDATAPTGSLAVRAMKSVRSLARITSWAQVGSDAKDSMRGIRKRWSAGAIMQDKSKGKEKEEAEPKRKLSKKESRKKDKHRSSAENDTKRSEAENAANNEEDERKKNILQLPGSEAHVASPKITHLPRSPSVEECPPRTLRRMKGQSVFGIRGAPDDVTSPAVPEVLQASSVEEQPSSTIGKKRSSILGLGIPSSYKFTTLRNRSSSSLLERIRVPNRPSSSAARSAANAHHRATSISSGFSFRPGSTRSGGSVLSERTVSSGTAVSVRWDEEGLRSAREMQRKERRSRALDGSRMSRNSAESKRRAAILDIFPEARLPKSSPLPLSASTSEHTTLVNEMAENSPTESSTARRRRRSISDPMSSRERPVRPADSDDSTTMSVLDAATEDLASLIDRLDLEVAPGAHLSRTRLSPASHDEQANVSQEKDTNRKGNSKHSLAGTRHLSLPLRGKAKSFQYVRSVDIARTLVSEQEWEPPPEKGPAGVMAAPEPTHQSEPLPTPDLGSPFVFKPLRISKAKSNSMAGASSSAAFGARGSIDGLTSDVPIGHEAASSPVPVFKAPAGNTWTRPSVSSTSLDKGKQTSTTGQESKDDVAEVFRPAGPSMERPDPNADILRDLHALLSVFSDDLGIHRLSDTLCSSSSSSSASSFTALKDGTGTIPGSATPILPPIPAISLYDQEDMPATSDYSEDHTNQSFGFIGERRRLNASGDQRSFVAELDRVFNSPPRIELDFGLNEPLSLDAAMLSPPFFTTDPTLPTWANSSREDAPSDETALHGDSSMSGYRNSFISEDFSQSPQDDSEDECRVYSMPNRTGIIHPQPSGGQLNRSFKFGGRPLGSDPEQATSTRPMTLSDIIPPIVPQVHGSSLISSPSSTEETSLQPESGAIDTSNSQPVFSLQRIQSNSSSHAAYHTSFTGSEADDSRRESHLSSMDSETFEEVGRGLSFPVDHLSSIYSPPGAIMRRPNGPDETVLSATLISSINSLSPAEPSWHNLLRASPIDTTSIPTSVHDTFSFMYRNHHQRSDSDASSVELRPTHVGVVEPREDQPTASMGSVAHPDASHGAGDGRAAWASHSRQRSFDSPWSEISLRPERPGLGDKMFNEEGRMPLALPAASPRNVPSRRPSWDSSIEGGQPSLHERPSGNRDSLTSASLDSVFGSGGTQQDRQLSIQQFRPVSVMSETSSHDSQDDDDTLITMLDGSRVRRRSIHSTLDASPCATLRTKQLPQVDDSIGEGNSTQTPAYAEDAAVNQFAEGNDVIASNTVPESATCSQEELPPQQGLLTDETHTAPSTVLTIPISVQLNSQQFTSVIPSSSPDQIIAESSSGPSRAQPSEMQGVNSAAVFRQARARALAAWHRRRKSQSAPPRSPVYETILEESYSSGSTSKQSPSASSAQDDDEAVADQNAEPIENDVDGPQGVRLLRQYYALKNEAHETIVESRQTWPNTASSINAVRSFIPPTTREGMRAMLKHSQEHYKSLPFTFSVRRSRSRASSKVSPYPSPSRVTPRSAEKSRRLVVSPKRGRLTNSSVALPAKTVLREISANTNSQADTTPPSTPPLKIIKRSDISNARIASSRSLERKPASPSPERYDVSPSVHQTTPDSEKHAKGKSSSIHKKENVGYGLNSPAKTLRLNRPRPRGRLSNVFPSRP